MSDQTKKKEKVLIIDGDGELSSRITEMLRNEGYTTFLVKTAGEGLKSLLEVLPNLAILDVSAPGGDAYDILEKKNAEPLLTKIPVFLVSSQGAPINMRRVPAGSVAEFILSLDSGPGDVVAMVDKYFGYTEQERKASENAATAKSATPKKKILWVEDDKLIGSILSRKFSSSDFDLTHVTNGEDALKKLSSMVPSAIILDLILPGMNGFDILQKIRMNEKFAKTPVMILSNLSKASDIEKAKVLGANKFMIKAASSLDQIIAEVAILSN